MPTPPRPGGVASHHSVSIEHEAVILVLGIGLIVIKKATLEGRLILDPKVRTYFFYATVQTLLLQLTVNHGLLDDGDNVGNQPVQSQTGREPEEHVLLIQTIILDSRFCHYLVLLPFWQRL